MSDKKTILIVDDNVDLVRMLELNLRAEGYRVLTAHDGEMGLQMANEFVPDLILLDMNMPKKGGLDFYREILEKDEHPKFPILILTAREALRGVFANLEVDGFISKPFELKVLLAEIKRIFSKRFGETSASEKVRKKSKKVLLIENDPEAFDKIVIAFLNAGYIVKTAKTGIAGIDSVMADQPDIILIN